MPAYNAELTLERTYRDIPLDYVDEIILVDDCSSDRTVEIARKLGLTVFVHGSNTGYGGNQKTCYAEALKRDPDAVIMIHPDYQYDARLIPSFLGFLEAGVCDIMLGNRIRTRNEALSGGMPLYKYVSNRLLTIFENMIMGQNLGDFHSGFRLYTGAVLKKVNFTKYSDDFVFDTQLLAQATYLGFKIGDAPVPVRYFPEASSIKLLKSLKYGFHTLFIMGQYLLQRAGIISSKLFQARDETI
ncbi:glycosyltransferase family 2 protein [bacterium]|nr:glycosyltransferase family 2 protein [bacterium]